MSFNLRWFRLKCGVDACTYVCGPVLSSFGYQIQGPLAYNFFWNAISHEMFPYQFDSVLHSVQNVNKPDHSNPLKMVRPVSTENDKIIRSPD